MRAPRAAAFLPLLIPIIASLGSAFGRDAAAAPLEWPQITSQAKPWARWWWLGNIGTDADFTSEAQKYAQAAYRGFIMGSAFQIGFVSGDLIGGHGFRRTACIQSARLAGRLAFRYDCCSAVLGDLPL